MNKIQKILTAACCMVTTSAFSIPTAVCDGPNTISVSSNISASFHVRRSYDFQDHDLSNATINWTATPSNINNTCKVSNNGAFGQSWDAKAKFSLNPFSLATICTITAAVTDNGSTSNCSINVVVVP